MVDRRIPILRGNLDLLVLKALTIRPMHGFELSEWLGRHSAGALDVLDSALYQSLYRLEARELVQAQWSTTGEGRRARYYAISAVGRRSLRTHAVEWTRYVRAVDGILAATN